MTEELSGEDAGGVRSMSALFSDLMEAAEVETDIAEEGNEEGLSL